MTTKVYSSLEELAEELLSGVPVVAALHQDIQDGVVLIHRLLQVVPLAIDCQKHFVEMPLVARMRMLATQLICICLSENVGGHVDPGWHPDRHPGGVAGVR